MKYIDVLALFFGFFLFPHFVFSQIVKQSNSYLLPLKMVDINDCRGMKLFFQDTMIKASKPGGLVIDGTSCSASIDYLGGKTAEFDLQTNLNLIVQKNSGFLWKENQSVINILPTKSIPRLLNVKIKELTLTFDTNLGIIIDNILQMDVIKEKIIKLKLKQGVDFGGLSAPPSNRPPTTITFRNETLFNILNEIVRKRGRGVWLYRESVVNNAKEFSLNFIVQ